MQGVIKAYDPATGIGVLVCDTDMPHDGPLPHTSHFDAIGFSCGAAGWPGSITLNEPSHGPLTPGRRFRLSGQP
jgi:hypothetical protein